MAHQRRIFISHIKQTVNKRNVLYLGCKLVRELIEDSEDVNFHYITEFYDAGDFKETELRVAAGHNKYHLYNTLE